MRPEVTIERIETHTNVVVIVFQGVVDEVAAFDEENQARAFFEARTGVLWDSFSERIKTEDSETILSDFAGSNIWDTEVL